MTDTATEAAVERQANELYWSSDQSVNQIADDLDLSKGVLYGLIQPLDAGVVCPVCGRELVYPNRTARDRGLVSCADCGWEGEEDDALPGPSAGREASLRELAEDVDVDEHDPLALQRQRTLWGGALLGAAAGLAVLMWARRR